MVFGVRPVHIIEFGMGEICLFQFCLYSSKTKVAFVLRFSLIVPSFLSLSENRPPTPTLPPKTLPPGKKIRNK